MPNRVVVGKALARQLLADDGDEGSFINIGVVKIAPTQRRNTHGPEVVRTGEAEAGIGQLAPVIAKTLPAFDRKRTVRIILPSRDPHGAAYRNHAGQGTKPDKKIVKRLSRLYEFRQGLGGSMSVSDQDAFRTVSEISRIQREKCAEEQSSTEGQYQRKRNLRHDQRI